MSDLYDRQKTLDIHPNITVTVVGCGGIGFWASRFLAMSGVDELFLYDPDVIEESNLNRLDLPVKTIGMNKADASRMIINQIRPEARILSFPFLFHGSNVKQCDWILDCTDKLKVQLENEKIAKENGISYLKAGYDGDHITVTNSIPTWGELDVDEGYTIVPSWVVPSVTVAALAVGRILKYSGDISTGIGEIFIK